MCLMSGFKESTGSRAPGTDGDQDGTHGEEDKRGGSQQAERTSSSPLFISFNFFL